MNKITAKNIQHIKIGKQSKMKKDFIKLNHTMKKFIHIPIIIITLLFICSCSQNNKTTDVTQTSKYTVISYPIEKNDNKINETQKSVPILPKIEPIWKNKKYGLIEDEVFFYDAPNGNKILNKQAMKYMEGIWYINAGTSCTIKIFDVKEDWAKVQVIEPDYLSASYIGWIKTNKIEGEEFTPAITISEVTYEIIKREKSNNGVENIYILYSEKEPAFNIMRAIINKVRKNNIKTNIYIFKNNQAIKLFDKANETKEDYIYVADNFICMSPFDMTSLIFMYPYQDIQYKEYGGENWKVDPIL